MRGFINGVGSFLASFFSPFWRGAKFAISAATAIIVFMMLIGLFVGLSASGHIVTLSDKGLVRVHETTTYSWKDPRHSGIQAAASPALTALSGSNKPIAVLTYDSMSGAPVGASSVAVWVDEIVANQNAFGGVLAVVTCPGGGVTEYGQIYAEMLRIKQQTKLPLVVCVDQVAASGGYMMILPADHIVAAPFATIGSIGVVSEMLNYHEALKKVGVQSVTITAGKYKRTVTPTDEVTDENKKLYQEKLASIHKQFIAKVTNHRKTVDPEKACNANTWSAEESLALDLGLVDELGTSHDLLFKLNSKHALVHVGTVKKENWQEQFSASVVDILDRVAQRIEMRVLDTRSPRNQPQVIAQ